MGAKKECLDGQVDGWMGGVGMEAGMDVDEGRDGCVDGGSKN